MKAHYALISLLFVSCASIESPMEIAQSSDAANAEQPNAQQVKALRFDKLWNYQDVNGTRDRFEGLLEEAETSWPQDLHLQLLTQIARTYSLQSKFDEAHGLLNEIESALPQGISVARVRYCLERGRTFNSDQQTAHARDMFLKAWRMANELEQTAYAVDAAHMLGIVETGQISLDWNHQAMRVAENSDDSSVKGWLGPLYNNTGWTHHDNGDYVAAMELWVKAQAWHAEFGSSRTQMIARWTVARCERSLGNYAKALELQLDLLQVEGVAHDDTGYTHEEIAENLWILDRRDESREHFGIAHEVLAKDTWLQANESQRIERLARLAKGASE